MKLNEIPKEELELMGYDDIALLILQESGKKMKLRDIFELMSINKKFIMLKNGFWDLQTRHKLDIVIEEDEEDEEELLDEEEDLEDIPDTEEDEDIFYDKDDETDDVDDDELADLVVIDAEDEANM